MEMYTHTTSTLILVNCGASAARGTLMSFFLLSIRAGLPTRSSQHWQLTPLERLKCMLEGSGVIHKERLSVPMVIGSTLQKTERLTKLKSQAGSKGIWRRADFELVMSWLFDAL